MDEKTYLKKQELKKALKEAGTTVHHAAAVAGIKPSDLASLLNSPDAFAARRMARADAIIDALKEYAEMDFQERRRRFPRPSSSTTMVQVPVPEEDLELWRLVNDGTMVLQEVIRMAIKEYAVARGWEYCNPAEKLNSGMKRGGKVVNGVTVEAEPVDWEALGYLKGGSVPIPTNAGVGLKGFGEGGEEEGGRVAGGTLDEKAFLEAEAKSADRKPKPKTIKPADAPRDFAATFATPDYEEGMGHEPDGGPSGSTAPGEYSGIEVFP